MDPAADAVSRAREAAQHRLRMWSRDALAIVLYLCGVFTLLTVITGFFAVLVGITAIVYAFGAWVILRSFLPARVSVAYLTSLLDGLRGHVLDARALDVKDEIPHGKAVLLLDNDVVLHVDRDTLAFLRLYSPSGRPVRPTLNEVVAWIAAPRAPYASLPPDSQSSVLGSLPQLQRLVTKWSVRSFDIGFRSVVTPAGKADDVSLDWVLGSARRSATLRIHRTRIAPAEILQEMDSIRDVIDSVWRMKQQVPTVSPSA